MLCVQHVWSSYDFSIIMLLLFYLLPALFSPNLKKKSIPLYIYIYIYLHIYDIYWYIYIYIYILWHCGVVVIATAQLHSTKPELRFCIGSNPALDVSKIPDGEDLWELSRLETRLNVFRRSTILQKQFIIIIIIILIIIKSIL